MKHNVRANGHYEALVEKQTRFILGFIVGFMVAIIFADYCHEKQLERIGLRLEIMHNRLYEVLNEKRNVSNN